MGGSEIGWGVYIAVRTLRVTCLESWGLLSHVLNSSFSGKMAKYSNNNLHSNCKKKMEESLAAHPA